MATGQAKYKVVGSPGSFAGGTGNMVVYTAANPAAGAGFTITVPNGKKWNIKSLQFSLTTSGVAGNRVVRAILKDGSGNSYFQASNHGTQPASQTVQQTVCQYLQMLTSNGQDAITSIPDVTMPGGHQLVINIGGIDAGDQVANITYIVEEFWD